MSIGSIILVCATGIMTVVGFVTMYIDKQKAIKHKWRVPEATLFAVAFLLGGVGSTLGMYVSRHKTKHWYFLVFMPILALWSIGITFALCYFVL